MNTVNRMNIIRMIENMDGNEAVSGRLGLKNKSFFLYSGKPEQLEHIEQKKQWKNV